MSENNAPLPPRGYGERRVCMGRDGQSQPIYGWYCVGCGKPTRNAPVAGFATCNACELQLSNDG